MQQYSALLRNRNFLLLWIGSAISSIGDFFNAVALVKVLADDPQHLGLWLSLVMIAKVVPGILLGPVAGVVADRLPRRTIMITADLLRAGLVAGLVFTAQPALIILLVTLAAVVSTFYGPASSALVPSLVKQEELVTANSLFTMTQRLAMLIGSGLGALVMAAVGAHSVFWIDSASFAITALFKVAMVLPAAAAVAAPAADAAKSLAARFTGDLKEALAFIRQAPTLRKLMTVIAFSALPDSALNVVMVTFFTVELGLAAERIGLVWALMGGSAVIGALAIGAIGGKVHWKHLLSFGGVYIWVCIVGAILVHNTAGASAFLALLGLGSGAFNVGFGTAIGTLVPDQVRGRIFGGWGMINNLIYVAGTLIGGALSDWIGATATLLSLTTFYLLMGLYSFVAFRHEGRPTAEPVATVAD